MLVLSILVTAGVIWQLHATGIAMVNETYCGLEEHQHDEECYEEVLVCGMNGAEGHVHSADCYEKQLVCGLEEHTHTEECLSDSGTYAESDADREESLPELTGIWPDDIVAVAESQLGYTESEEQYILSDDGMTQKGYTIYGDWYGNEYADWDAMFVSFCLYYAGISEEYVSYASGAYAQAAAMKDSDYYENTSDYTPVSGDMVFFDLDDDGRADSVGIVTDVSDDEMTVIEGDSHDQVEQNVYSISSAYAFVNITAAYESAATEAASTEEILLLSEANDSDEESEDAGTDGSDAPAQDDEETEEEDSEGSDENAGISVAAETDENNELSLTASSGDNTVYVGGSITLTGSGNNNKQDHQWLSGDNSIATVSGNGSSATVTGVSAGTVTITHKYKTGGPDGHWVTETFEVTVTNTITVYVYVSATGFSDELLNILGVKEVSDGYFAAGTVKLDMSQLSGDANCKIKSETEWNYVISMLTDGLDTSKSTTCPDNEVASYAKFVCKDLYVIQGKGYSGLWVSTGHSQITDDGGTVDSSGNPVSSSTQYWHLDLRFETVTITFEYGNNGIADGTAADYSIAGTEVFIKGAAMTYTPAITVPEGYRIEGYYIDENFTTVWNGFNEAIEQDTTVYIKLVPDTYVLPSTGGMGSVPFTMTGLIIAGTASGMFCYRCRRKSRIKKS